MKPFRMQLRTCIRKQTFYYYFTEETAAEVCRALTERYGEPRVLSDFNIAQIETESLLIRYVPGNSRITVVFKDGCSENDITVLHKTLGFDGEGKE